jgi:glycosyltransferase involved in cell wall biosynthesis
MLGERTDRRRRMQAPRDPSSIPLAPAGAPLAVAVQAAHLLGDARGIGRYVRALLPRLLALRPGLRLTLYAKDRRDAGALERSVASDPALAGRVDTGEVRAMARARADVFWYPWNFAGPVPAEGAVVVTMHDVAPVVLRDVRVGALWQKFLWRRRYAVNARRATVILTNSGFTAGEVERVLGFPRERIRVTLLAADDLPVPPAGDADAALARLGVTTPFLLAVGAAGRRKNLGVLCRAMERVVTADPGVRLVLAGVRDPAAAGVPDVPWIRTPGFVSDADLAALYRTAAALVQPSTYEGFGLPVLEAMRLGAPVICARASSLPEVAGDAAAWFDPADDEGLAAAIARVLSDDGLRAAMSAAGIRRAAEFSWDDTARRTLEGFDEAVRFGGAAGRP